MSKAVLSLRGPVIENAVASSITGVAFGTWIAVVIGGHGGEWIVEHVIRDHELPADAGARGGEPDSRVESRAAVVLLLAVGELRERVHRRRGNGLHPSSASC